MNTTDARLTARLFSAAAPDSAQKAKLEDVLSKKYGKAVDLVWQEDRTVVGGITAAGACAGGGCRGRKWS